jgi:hypothetical protein
MSESEWIKLCPAVAAVLDVERLNDLGPGTPERARQEQLRALTAESLLAPLGVKNRQMAGACLAGLWLYYDFMDESHGISQSLDTAEGSYWHGILHRREPDYNNAKYWMRRVGQHSIHPALAAQARVLATAHIAGSSAQFLLNGQQWEPARFVDLCAAAARDSSTDHKLCRLVQQAEWNLLFGHCLQRAAGIDR